MTPVVVDEKFLAAHPLPDHSEGGSKDHRGRVLIVAGSRQVPGAAILAGTAALRAGAGVLQIATCVSVATAIAVAMPEAMVIGCRETAEGGIVPGECDAIAELATGVDALVIGPGMMDAQATGELTASLLRTVKKLPVVLDAAAMTTLGNCQSTTTRQGATILTPHAGEMASYLDIAREEVEADMLAAARQAAARSGAIVVMKGAETSIAGPDGEAWISRHGSSSLATSGSGDTLAGILAGLLARGVPPAYAALWAVYVHGEAGVRLAGRYGHVGALAREIPGEVPLILHELAGRVPDAAR